MAEEIREKKEKKFIKSEELADRYPLYIQVATTITLVLFILMFLTVKTLEVKPYKPRSEVATLVEEIPEQLEEYEEPPPPPKPKLPVQVEETTQETEEEQQEEIEFTPTTEFNELEVPPPPKVDTTYEFYAVEVKPRIVKRVEPEYPELAKRAGIEGQVFVKVLVDETGHVIQAKILRSTNEIFNEPALKAARQFVFTPGMQRDRPVKVWVAIPFRFRLTH